MNCLVRINGEWLRYDHRSRFKLDGMILLGVSDETQYRGVKRLHPRKYYFYRNIEKPQAIEPGTQPDKVYPVSYDKLNHLIESAIELRAILEDTPHATKTSLYIEICRMIGTAQTPEAQDESTTVSSLERWMELKKRLQCACGCGKPLKKTEYKGKPIIYLRGHNK